MPAAAEFGDLFPEPVVVALEGQQARRPVPGRPACDDAWTSSERVLDGGRAKRGLLDILADALVTEGLRTGLPWAGSCEGIGVIEIGERIAASEHGFMPMPDTSDQQPHGVPAASWSPRAAQPDRVRPGPRARAPDRRSRPAMFTFDAQASGVATMLMPWRLIRTRRS